MGSWRCVAGVLCASGTQMRRDLAMALSVVLVVALFGSLAFSVAQSWRRKQDLLFPRDGKAWLPLALGAAFPAGFLLAVAYFVLLFRLHRGRVGAAEGSSHY